LDSYLSVCCPCPPHFQVVGNLAGSFRLIEFRIVFLSLYFLWRITGRQSVHIETMLV
jgi:hypothetical protein